MKVTPSALRSMCCRKWRNWGSAELSGLWMTDYYYYYYYWMTEGKISCCFQIAFIIMNACFKVKFSYSGKGPWPLGCDWIKQILLEKKTCIRPIVSVEFLRGKISLQVAKKDLSSCMKVIDYKPKHFVLQPRKCDWQCRSVWSSISILPAVWWKNE